MTKPTLLIDGDLIAYQVAAASEVPIQWDEDTWTLHSSMEDARHLFRDKVAAMARLAGAPNAGGQYEYEPPRTARGVKNGAKRLRALGNCNPPQQYQPAILFIKSLSDML